jgi:hypothetical protein
VSRVASRALSPVGSQASRKLDELLRASAFGTSGVNPGGRAVRDRASVLSSPKPAASVGQPVTLTLQPVAMP